jgi:DNA-binding transcriptional MerR regulator
MTNERTARPSAGTGEPDEDTADETTPGPQREPLAPAKVPTAPPRPGRTSNDRLPGSPIHADKPVFTLSVAADLLGMHPRTLRIYEEERLVVPYRTDTQRRRYSQNDIKRFQFIQHLTQRLHVNLAGVRIILEMLEELSKLGVDYTTRLYEMAEEQLPTTDPAEDL